MASDLQRFWFFRQPQRVQLVVVAGGLAFFAASSLGALLLIGLFIDDDEDASASANACERAPTALVSAISEGVEDGLSLRAARMVRSNDYDQLWFVAADLQGPGLDRSDDIAIWSAGSVDGGGPIFSADAVAAEFSDWGRPGDITHFSDHGYDEANDCALEAAR